MLSKTRFRINEKWKRCYSSVAERISKEDDSIINYKMVLGLKRIDIFNLSSLCRDFHNIFRIDKYQLLKYANDILPYVKYLRTSEIVMILHHYTFINYNNHQFYNTLWTQIINKLHDMDCKELALIIYSMGKIKYMNKEMILFFEKEIKKWASKLTGRDCSLILKGMKNLNYDNEQIFSLIYERILNITDQLNLLDICIILNTHSKCKNINIRVFEILLNKSLTFYSSFNEQCIGSILWSISNANIKAEKYFALLSLRLRLLMHKKLLREGHIRGQEDTTGAHGKSDNSISRVSSDNSISSGSRVSSDNSISSGSRVSSDNSISSGSRVSSPNCTHNEDSDSYDNSSLTVSSQKGNTEKSESGMYYGNNKNNLRDKIVSSDKAKCTDINNVNSGTVSSGHASRSTCEEYVKDEMLEDNLSEDTNILCDNTEDTNNLNFQINPNSRCKYENVIPSIIYSYGKQRTYMKHHINFDKSLYNYIMNSYNIEEGINNAPLDTLYIYDISRKILKNNNIFNNNANEKNKKNNKIVKYHTKKNYYKDIIYIINNYLIFFLNKVHYNDLKNVLYGIAKIEMSINKKLYHNIFELVIIYVKQNMYKSYELINLSRSLSLLPHVKEDVWKCVLDYYKNNFLSNTSVKNNSYLFYIVSFVKKLQNNSNFHLYLIEHINKKAPTISKDDVIHIIRGLINLHYYHNDLVNNVSIFIEKNYQCFNLIDIVYILKYFTSMKFRHVNIFSLFALTVQKNNITCNYSIISTIASFYLQMDIFPKAIEDVLLQEKKNSERNFKTEEIYCDEE
ncbi:conserved Plasmodium protein, unknown function [Plasmodium malariae]|uniref:RNA-editing substrate-binding complex 6 protein domain-containing protein n=1 Tax=Plasmodium malariae TaxID=5858 RepID=A0A1D3PAP4_PLAMA|nr:conserved Plasmodium protein, unknown function [Plasmodium malariae]SCN12134.1 conserved Plasmodium protein, unknown function [Plasmodium malariae]